MDWIDIIQWPAMAATLLGAWLLASDQARTRIIGFAVFCLSNVMWVIWGWHDQAWALVSLQVGLFFLNSRGIKRNNEELEEEEPETKEQSLVEKLTLASRPGLMQMFRNSTPESDDQRLFDR